MRGSSKSASSTISRISSSLSASASFFPCHGSIFHPVWPSYALTPVSPCSENSSRTLFGRLFSWRTAASKPPPPVNFPLRRNVFTARIFSMPPTVFRYLAMMSSAVWAASGGPRSASPTRLSISFRMEVLTNESARPPRATAATERRRTAYPRRARFTSDAATQRPRLAPSERNALAHRDRPVAAGGEPFAEAVSQGELAHVTVEGAGRPQAQGQSHVAAEPDGIGRVPRAAVIEEGRDPNADQAPQLVAYEQAILQREPHHAVAGELVNAEHSRSLLQHPQVELGARLGLSQRAALEVEHERLAPQVLARHGEAAGHACRVEAARRVDPVRGAPQHDEPARPQRAHLAARFRADAGAARRIAPGAGRGPQPKVQQLGDVHVLTPRVRVEALQHLKAHVPDVHSRPRGRERRAREDGQQALGAEILTAPLPADPEPHVAAARGVGGDARADTEPQRPAPDGGVGPAVAEPQHPLRGRLPVRDERAPRTRLVERNAEGPDPAFAVRLAGVLGPEPHSPAEEVRTDVAQVEDRAVRRLLVDGRERGGGAEQVLFHQAGEPGHIPAGGRVTELRLGAPAVEGLDAQRETPGNAGRVQPDAAEDVQAAQRPLALRHPRGVVAVARIHEQRAPDHAGARRHVQRVREPGEKRRGVVLEVKDVVVDDDERVDGLGG